MLNPLTNKPLDPDAAEKIEQLRTVRRDAGKHVRSGNPAKRVPAQRAVALAGALIRTIARREVS